ncbi:MAG TPA: RNA polymerase sigma factor [Burkholderiales bacterium]|nr:RNA polymerase sigma factor [Burkholderiales bacterium]
MNEKQTPSLPPLPQLKAGREQFLALVEELRPQLHRYCARMTGSITEGEDIVQDTLAHAYYELGQLNELPAMRAWLFRIAHNRALDHLRRYERRMVEALEENHDMADENAPNPEDKLARDQALAAAVSRFMELAPAQRSSVILKDVLDHPLEEISELLDLSVSAVKAALHRGREKLKTLAAAAASTTASPAAPVSPELARYVALFNARDWDGVRAMLAEDLRVDVVARVRKSGAGARLYFTTYDSLHNWRFAPAWLEEREVIAVYRPDAAEPAYIIDLDWQDGKITAIRDYVFVPYITRDAAIVMAA